MAATLEQVVKQLTDSGIIAPVKLEPFIPPNAAPKTVEELVQALVKSENLTAFQGQQVKVGKAKALILGAYTILDKIGAGGMGQVFKAEHRKMGRLVAIKMLPPAMTKDAAAIARFEREVRAAAKLRHPNIVAADDAAEANGAHFLVMEYIEGKDLSALVKKNGPFPVGKAVNYILQAARGLEFAHKKGVVHRDIKPANLLLDNEEAVKILDMGLARLDIGGEAGPKDELTGTGTIMGTVDFMAPEQALNTKKADHRADIYSLGISLHYLVAGKSPYTGDTVMEKLLAHRESPIPSLGEAQPDVPADVDAVFKKMVAKKIENRYQSMTEVVADLEKCRTALSSASTSVFMPSKTTHNDDMSDLSMAMAHSPLRSIESGFAPQAEPEKKPRKAKAKPKTGRPVLLGLVAAGLLLGGGGLAGVIFSLKTEDGTLVVEVNQPDAMVQVLDKEGKVEITQPGGLNPIAISVDPGEHQLRVEKDGFVVIGENFKIESGGKLAVKARLVPIAEKGLGASGEGLAKTGATAGLSSSASGASGSASALWFKNPAFQAWAKTVAALPAEQQVEAVSKKLMELNPGFDGKLMDYGRSDTPKIENGVVTTLQFFAYGNMTDISPVRALVGLKSLNIGTGGGTTPSKLADLSPLRGMGLTILACDGTQVSDLSPLEGMKLSQLYCTSTPVSDLTPLDGMPLAILRCSATQVSDLSPLESRKSLYALNVVKTNVTPAQVAALQKALPNCKIEWDGAEKGLGASGVGLAKPWNTPAFQQWVKATQALPAEKQIEAVSKKLMELNPGFDGRLTGWYGQGTPLIENGVVTGCGFFTDSVTDISPVRVLAGLKQLWCQGSSPGKGRLSDLPPLNGMKLTYLFCKYTPVSDLSPLEGMPLTQLGLPGTQVSDLSPLQGMRLIELTCSVENARFPMSASTGIVATNGDEDH